MGIGLAMSYNATPASRITRGNANASIHLSFALPRRPCEHHDGPRVPRRLRRRTPMIPGPGLVQDIFNNRPMKRWY